jgi:arylsulfatase A-like enzyme
VSAATPERENHLDGAPGLVHAVFMPCLDHLLAIPAWLLLAGALAAKPNIVVILTDDQGYADISFNPDHPKEVSTPRMDALAREGVFFTHGYISGNVCAPTRAGLMTGRYQQRAGIYTGGEGGAGLPLKEKTFAQYLKEAGYVCGAFGKWHMGVEMAYHPLHRGFDTFYGFMGRGAHDYFALAGEPSEFQHPMYRDLEEIKDKGYLTTRLTEEAVAFIRKNQSAPFFLYLAYNAVHAPAQAPEADIRKFDTGDPKRDILMAMLLHLDRGIGAVVDTLKAGEIFDDTLLFFLTDNGGARAMRAHNAPLRGFKQDHYEGGIRTPFVVCWPKHFQGGRKLDQPVISLDILPTALAAAGAEGPDPGFFDGRNLLPLLTGATTGGHETLFWSEGGQSGEWAVRSGNWKLVAHGNTRELFDLAADPSEEHDLHTRHPEVVRNLEQKYDNWLESMAAPASGQPKRWNSTLPSGKRSKEERARRRDERKPG